MKKSILLIMFLFITNTSFATGVDTVRLFNSANGKIYVNMAEAIKRINNSIEKCQKISFWHAVKLKCQNRLMGSIIKNHVNAFSEAVEDQVKMPGNLFDDVMVMRLTNSMADLVEFESFARGSSKSAYLMYSGSFEPYSNDLDQNEVILVNCYLKYVEDVQSITNLRIAQNKLKTVEKNIWNKFKFRSSS